MVGDHSSNVGFSHITRCYSLGMESSMSSLNTALKALEDISAVLGTVESSLVKNSEILNKIYRAEAIANGALKEMKRGYPHG